MQKEQSNTEIFGRKGCPVFSYTSGASGFSIHHCSRLGGAISVGLQQTESRLHLVSVYNSQEWNHVGPPT